MRINLSAILPLILFLDFFTSCQKEVELDCIYCTDSLHYELILDYPKSASIGDYVVVQVVLYGSSDKIILIKWYADDFPFPQSLRRIDTLGTAYDGGYRFTFPKLSEGKTEYYVRCIFTNLSGLTLLERTISIGLKK